MYARLFYLLHIIFNFLKGYIMSKTTNQILIDFLDFKIAMLKGEVAVCEEMRTELIKNEDDAQPVQRDDAQPVQRDAPQANIFQGDIQPEINNTQPSHITPMDLILSSLSVDHVDPVSTACSLPHFVS